MKYPTYKGPARFTYKEVKRLFYIKYKNGFITKKINTNTNTNMKYSVEVNYTNGGQTYNYSVCSYTELVSRLDISDEVREALKVFDAEMVKYTSYIKTEEYIKDCKNNDEFGFFN